MLALLSSLAALGVGPLLVGRVHPDGRVRVALDVFVVVVIAGLVLLHVLPEAVEVAGWPAATAAAIGMAVPVFVHRFSPGEGSGRSRTFAALGLLALLTHAIVDGVAIAADREDSTLALAVALHRIPLSVSVWWLGATQIGRTAALAILATEGIGTLVGYFLAVAWLPAGGGPLMSAFQALVGGAVLHVLLDHGPGPARWRQQPEASVSGLLFGIVCLVVVAMTRHVH